MKTKPYYEYLGHIIWRGNGVNRSGLKYSSLGIGAADTLEGMRKMIRESK